MQTPAKGAGVLDANAANMSHHYPSFPRVAVADSVFAQKFSPDPNVIVLPGNNDTSAAGSPEVPHHSSTPGSASELKVTRSQLMGQDSDDLNDSSVSLSRIKTSGKARTTKTAVALPSAGDAYPLSAECSKMSSREVHRRLRSQSQRSQPTAATELAATNSEPTNSATPEQPAPAPALSAPSNYMPSKNNIPPVPTYIDPPIITKPVLMTNPYSVAPSTAAAPTLLAPEASMSPRIPVTSTSSAADDINGGNWQRGRGANVGVTTTSTVASSLKVVRSSRKANVLSQSPTDEFANRMGVSFSKAVNAAHGKTPKHSKLSPRAGSPNDSSEWGVSAALSVGASASSFSSASVMSEATTVYTDIGCVAYSAIVFKNKYAYFQQRLDPVDVMIRPLFGIKKNLGCFRYTRHILVLTREQHFADDVLKGHP